MTLQIIDQNQTSASITIDLGSADDAFICAGVSVVSTEDFAISTSGDDQTVNLQGSAFAAVQSAIDMGNGANTSSGLHLIIGPAGYAGSFSSEATVVMRGSGNRVDNAGFIDGDSFGLELKGGPNSVGETNIVNNSGRIEGDIYGVFRQDGDGAGDETIIFNNSGEVRTSGPGGYAYFTGHHESTDHITNSGLMVGNITLEEGDDIYDGSGGRVIGWVIGGAADDSLTGGDFDDLLYGGSQDDVVSGGAGNDTLGGGNDLDSLFGGAGNDTLDGGTGADTMDGGAGNDLFIVDNAGDRTIDNGGGIDLVKSSVAFNFGNAAQAGGGLDNLTMTGIANINGAGNGLANTIQGNIGNNFIHGMAGNDTVFGNDGNDRLWGDAGNDSVSGGNGTDVLYGGLGNDKLTGGALADKFVFDAKPNLLNRDTITDFQHGVDKIQLEHAVFAGIGGAGGLNPAFFFQGAAAHDANDRVIYNKATGVLSYDNDGTGAHAAIQCAVLFNKPVVSASDFQVI